ncbi:MAG: ATP-binding cassette domain-containing protein [Anaerolineae bacterium]|nr:ATP-binding cassette domain-containing protein [Phycisphaerae bacterium]
MSSSDPSSDIAISVRGVGKSYTIRHNLPRHTTLGEAIVDRIRQPFRRGTSETFWALKDVSFDVKKGEVVGIIGRNGAGKSTLLKILSRITEPTTGQIDLYGRVGSLLEVGTGFHQELTGRENIFLNGAILGMSRAEIKKEFDAIVDFSGVEQFLDTPVKRYSSGMYVRLAFAVAAHLRSEILVVDEVLAVGDAEFQKKCLGKLKEVSTDGRTVLLVSHNLQSLVSLCQTGCVLATGGLLYWGDIEQAAKEYTTLRQRSEPDPFRNGARRRRGSGQYRFSAASFTRECFRSDEAKVLRFEIVRHSGELVRFFIVADLCDDYGNIVFHTDSNMRGVSVPDAPAITGEYVFRSPWLKPGRYSVTLQIGAGALIDEWECACDFEVVAAPFGGGLSAESTKLGTVFADFDLAIELEGNVPTVSTAIEAGKQQPAAK